MKNKEKQRGNRSVMRVGVITCLSATVFLCGVTGVAIRSLASEEEQVVEVIEFDTIDISNTLVEESVDTYEAVQLSIAELEPEMEVVETERVIIFPSIEFVSPSGKIYTSNELTIYPDRLVKAYEIEATPEWDCRGYVKEAAAIWEFLVNQNNVSPEIASAIIGNCAYEGRFGSIHNKDVVLQNIDETRHWVYNSSRGMGICQWCFRSRKDGLCKFYETANNMGLNDYHEVSMVAELSYMLAELSAYGLFDNLQGEHNVQTATGNIARNYESYDGVEKDFAGASNGYSLIRSNCNGSCRLNYAIDTYNYFTQVSLCETGL